MLKLATIAGVLVLTAGTFAADKPAAAARMQMETEKTPPAVEVAFTTTHAGGGVAFAAKAAPYAVKPALANRNAMEAEFGGGAEAYVVEVPAKHEAANVGFTGKTTVTEETWAAPKAYAEKPAAAFRLNQGR